MCMEMSLGGKDLIELQTVNQEVVYMFMKHMKVGVTS